MSSSVLKQPEQRLFRRAIRYVESLYCNEMVGLLCCSAALLLFNYFEHVPKNFVSRGDNSTSDLWLEQTVVDIGNVNVNSEYKHRFTLYNQSEKEITIVDAIPSCTCTSLGLHSKTLRPGDSTQIDATLSSGMTGGRINSTVNLIYKFENLNELHRISFSLSGQVLTRYIMTTLMDKSEVHFPGSKNSLLTRKLVIHARQANNSTNSTTVEASHPAIRIISHEILDINQLIVTYTIDTSKCISTVFRTSLAIRSDQDNIEFHELDININE